MDPLGGISDNDVETHRMGKLWAELVDNPQIKHLTAKNVGKLQTKNTRVRNAKLKEDEFWPLSGRPYFNLVLSKSQVKPSYQLFLPAKMLQILPSSSVPVVLTYCGKKWEMVYFGDRSHKRFDPSWKAFANDNDLKAGDACVFELMECSSKIIKFRVQILKGDFPPELLERVNGETSNTPIVIE